MVLREGLYLWNPSSYVYVQQGDRAWGCFDRTDIIAATKGESWKIESKEEDVIKSLSLPCEFLKVVT